MYSEQDMNEINARIRRHWLALAPVLLVIAAGYVWALAARQKALAMALGPLLFVAACYGVLARLLPCLRYRRFLKDVASGLSRDMRGTIVAVSDAPELQDGAMVLPVRLRLAADEAGGGEKKRGSALSERLQLESDEDTRQERIVYLNASKREGFPAPGTAVALHCFGRHILACSPDGPSR